MEELLVSITKGLVDEPDKVSVDIDEPNEEGVTVYLDASLKKYETVFPACGSSNSAIELTIPEMEKYSGHKEWVDVCKENN